MRKWIDQISEKGYCYGLLGLLLISASILGSWCGMSHLRNINAKPLIAKEMIFNNIETGIADVQSTVYLEERAIARYAKQATRTMLVEKNSSTGNTGKELWAYFEVPGRPNIFAAQIYSDIYGSEYRLHDYKVTGDKLVIRTEAYIDSTGKGFFSFVIIVILVIGIACTVTGIKKNRTYRSWKARY